MGTYDTIRCLYPLHADGANDLEYQTKDALADAFIHYEIREDGSLWQERREGNGWLTPDSCPNDIRKLPTRLIMEHCGWNRKNFTGTIVFYGSLPRIQQPDRWIEWEAEFSNGLLVSIRCLSEQTN